MSWLQVLMNKHEKPPLCLPYSTFLELRRPNVTRKSYSMCDGEFQQNAQKPLCSSVRCLSMLYVIFVFPEINEQMEKKSNIQIY